MRGFRLNPITRKRLRRFRSLRRAWWSFCILSSLYAISLFAHFLANDTPLWVRYEGRSYFPLIRYYPLSEFTDTDRHTRPNYKALNETPAFADEPGNFIFFPPIPHSPHEIIPPGKIDIPDRVQVTVERERRVGSLDFDAEGRVLRANRASAFFDKESDAQLRNRNLDELFDLPDGFTEAVAGRLDNRSMPTFTAPIAGTGEPFAFQLRMGAFEPAARPPRFVRATLREALPEEEAQPVQMSFDRDLQTEDLPADFWDGFSEEQRAEVEQRIADRFDGTVEDSRLHTPEGLLRVRYDREVVTYPFRPVRGHPLGLDASGRDVGAHILYALRTSMSFGLLLVFATMLIGIVMGALQGYFGGFIDITSQRLIEIWSALPFLYIIILLGSIYGRSFTLLLICYGIFNWIGISYYIRAEFLRLRKQPFVEAARVMGLKRARIIFKHILPNALVPIITFFPFSLVGAIGSLAALDYLGFGMPATSPSWGALLAQAQEFRFAWWLVLYPSLALFIVILLGVFIGEGARSAFDPRGESEME